MEDEGEDRERKRICGGIGELYVAHREAEGGLVIEADKILKDAQYCRELKIR